MIAAIANAKTAYLKMKKKTVCELEGEN